MIVTAGENVVDMIMQADGRYVAVPGGSPLNIAMALATLGVPAGYAMPVSSDLFGDDMLSAMAQRNVRYMPKARPDRPTGLAIVKVGGDGQPHYSFYRQGAADVELRPGELPKLGPEVTHLHVGGSPSLGNDSCGGMLCDWALSVDGAVSLSVDPNVRPALIDDKAAFLDRCDRLAGRSSVYRLSDEDAHYMYGDLDADNVADSLLEKGVALVINTLGDQGSLLATANVRLRVPAFDTAVRDTVAAGDCFYAATLSWLQDNGALSRDKAAGLGEGQLRELGSFASAAASINCSRDGCDPPTKGEVLDLVASAGAA